MDPAEYDIMRRVEDAHWWYGALRGMIGQMLRVHAAPSGRLLDIGCGTGANLAMMESQYDVVGLDRSSIALGHCRARNLAELTLGSALDLPFANDTFDAVTMMDVLYHAAVDPPLQAVDEARRVLRPGGVFVVNVPAYEWLRSSHDEHIHTARRFTRGRLLELLRESGFEVETATYWNTALFPAVAAVRLLRKGGEHEASDLADFKPSPIGTLLSGLFALERAAIRLVPMPCGVSIMGVARKRD